MLTTVQTILLAALLVVLMAGMGASLTMNDFRECSGAHADRWSGCSRSTGGCR